MKNHVPEIRMEMNPESGHADSCDRMCREPNALLVDDLITGKPAWNACEGRRRDIGVVGLEAPPIWAG